MCVVGYLRGPRPDGLDCERPLLVVCQHCSHRDVWACSNHRTSRCRPCSGRYRRRVQSVASEGMRRRGGFFYLLTVTAPGDRAHTYGRSSKRCPCTPPGGVDLSRWNPTAAARWNHLLVLVEREYSVRPRYFRAAETQKRGALHHHAIVWSPRKLSEKRLRALAIRAGFGHEVDLQPIDNPAGVAEYVTKTVAGYVTKSADSRDEIPWWAEYVDTSTGEVLQGRTFARYRTWSQSRDWGTSMALIRRAAMDKAKQLQQLRDASVHSATVVVSAPDPLTTGTSPPPS